MMQIYRANESKAPRSPELAAEGCHPAVRIAIGVRPQLRYMVDPLPVLYANELVIRVFRVRRSKDDLQGFRRRVVCSPGLLAAICCSYRAGRLVELPPKPAT